MERKYLKKIRRIASFTEILRIYYFKFLQYFRHSN